MAGLEKDGERRLDRTLTEPGAGRGKRDGRPGAAQGALAVPGDLGPYRLESELGRGGMGVVYAALDTRLDRRVAIKVVTAHSDRDGAVLKRLEREARLLASFSHPNIATIYSLEEIGGISFFVLELIPGTALSEILAEGPLSLDRVLSLTVQVARALERAHEKQIVHLDLKPSNIMVTPRDEVKILDFGIARALAGDPEDSAAAGDVEAAGSDQEPDLVTHGTPGYMSPEQLNGLAVDERADVWAFGCVLYECLTGSRAFVRETVNDSIGATLQEPIDLAAIPDSVPESLVDVMRRCLVRDRAQRLSDMVQICAMLESEVRRRRQRAAMRISFADIIEGMARIGEPAPLFTLRNARDRDVSLESLLAGGPVALVFFRGKW